MNRATPQKNVKVVVEQRVGEDAPAAAGGMMVEEPPPVVAVLVVEHDVAPLQPALRNVVDTIRNVQPWLSRHDDLRKRERHIGQGSGTRVPIPSWKRLPRNNRTNVSVNVLELTGFHGGDTSTVGGSGRVDRPPFGKGFR